MSTAHLHQAINKQLANWIVLFVKLHHYHWYVKGEHFFTLHAKFEELYQEASTHLDNLAERLLQLGGKPVATMNEALQEASVREAAGNESPQQMVENTANDFEIMTAELKQAMEISDSLKDETTSDMLLAIHNSLEKHIWMLKSFLG
jgi:starvation-inducible DNA-binding protein